jgi:hypothetical protein
MTCKKKGQKESASVQGVLGRECKCARRVYGGDGKEGITSARRGCKCARRQGEGNEMGVQACKEREDENAGESARK